MKGFFYALLLWLPVTLTAQEVFPSEQDSFWLMRRGSAGEIERFADSWSEDPLWETRIDRFFYEAAAWNPEPRVLDLLVRYGADVNREFPLGRTSLMAAARFNNSQVVQRILELGADPARVDVNGQTALHVGAAYTEDYSVPDVLAEGGTPFLLCDKKGKTAFELAITRQNNQMVLEGLIDLFGDPYYKNLQGDNLYSLVFRIRDNSLRSHLVRYLYDGKFPLILQNREGQTPLEEAESLGLGQVVHELQIYREQLQNDLFQEMELFTGESPRYSKVKEYLLRGADPFSLNPVQLSPYHLAVVGGYPEIFRLLLEYRGNRFPFEQGLEDFNRNMPFFALSHSEDNALALLSMLLDLGYSPDLVDPDGNPLLTQSLYSSLKAADLLLKKGADTEIREPYDVTPLMRAGALDNGAEASALLLKYGADENARDDDGWQPLFYTVLFGGSEQTVEELLQAGADINEIDNYGSSVLLWSAAYSQDPGMLEFLVKEGGASLHQRDKDGWIPLMAALHWKNTPRVAALFLEALPDGRVKDGLGRTVESYLDDYTEDLEASDGYSLKTLLKRRVYPPDAVPVSDLDLSLHETAEWGRDPRMVELLVDAGAGVDAPDRDGWTPLMKAAAYNTPGMVKALLDKGADPEYATRFGWTPLHTAGWSDYAMNTKILLDYGADPSAPDREGWTPFHWAVRNHAPLEALEYLYQTGADPSDVTLKGETALFLLTSGWDVPGSDIVRFLLEYGGDPDRGDSEGETPLMHAASRGYQEALIMLLKAGADRNRKDIRGNTAVDYAESEGFYQLSDLLKEY